MPLDPQARAFLERPAEPGAPVLGESPVEDVRRAAEDDAPVVFGPFDTVPYDDRVIAGPAAPIPVRVYSPGGGDAPVLVYFHGGGWVLGSVATAHGVCSTLARGSGCVVVSVDYRLAPEHPFPAALDDAWAAVEWAAANAAEVGGRPGALAVGGDSSGGNLAAVVALRARDAGLPLAGQLLVYPVLDADFEASSYRAYAEGFGLTRAGMEWFFDQYVPDGDRFRPEISPLRCSDLAGVATALVITAEYDVLRDEGEAYAQRLSAAGVPVQLSRYGGMIHGFFRLPGVIDRGHDALDEAATAISAAFA